MTGVIMWNKYAQYLLIFKLNLKITLHSTQLVFFFVRGNHYSHFHKIIVTVISNKRISSVFDNLQGCLKPLIERSLSCLQCSTNKILSNSSSDGRRRKPQID